MNPEQMLSAFLTTVREHLQLPGGYEWAPTAAIAAVGVAGLLLMIRGAKWAPGVGALLFLFVGAFVGRGLCGWLGTPEWPSVGITAVASCSLAIALFRIWQAVLLSVCCIVASLGAYYVHDLTGPVSAWVNGDGTAAITLPAADAAELTAWAKAKSLFDYLAAGNVPNFEFNFWALVCGAGVAGLVFGLVLPRASRSIWAATIGTALLGVGTTGMLDKFAPQALAWLLADAPRAWGIVGGVWTISLIWNLVSSGPRRAREPEAAVPAKAAVA
ncbi:MAG: hypothetical protein HZB38_17300 [Planctomycetes bacterium]|nr:hypothetical protein [Planctomycetota bacterium]